MNAVFFETDSDSTTKKVHEARRKALAYTTAYPEYHLFGINAFACDVVSTHAKAGSFGLFSGMGHGGSDHFTGQANTVYDVRNSYSANHTVKGAIVHLYSCDCGTSLGPHLVNLGAKAFIGYVNCVEVPNSQVVADEFVKVAAVIDRSILNGDSHTTSKTKADIEFAAVEAKLRAPGSGASPRDLARFRMNHRAMVGPWSGRTYGCY